MMTDQSRRGRSRWTRTVEERFGPSSDVEAEPRSRAVHQVGGTESILLVEDQDQVRVAARTVLERRGYRVDAMRSADEALRHVRGGAEVDLLLTDVVLPGMNGVALAERVVAERGGIRVLFMSAYASEETVLERAVQGRPCAFLPKPFSLDLLARTVRELLDRVG
jgi:DNA-binding NtrC family response regulator